LDLSHAAVSIFFLGQSYTIYLNIRAVFPMNIRMRETGFYAILLHFYAFIQAFLFFLGEKYVRK